MQPIVLVPGGRPRILPSRHSRGFAWGRGGAHEGTTGALGDLGPGPGEPIGAVGKKEERGSPRSHRGRQHGQRPRKPVAAKTPSQATGAPLYATSRHWYAFSANSCHSYATLRKSTENAPKCLTSAGNARTPFCATPRHFTPLCAGVFGCLVKRVRHFTPLRQGCRPTYATSPRSSTKAYATLRH